jgi:hypothetical protein
MRWEDEPVRIPAAMAAELEAEQDRFLATLRRDEVQARVEAAWKASDALCYWTLGLACQSRAGLHEALGDQLILILSERSATAVTQAQ